MIIPRIKICGITRPEDATLALQLGADYLGMIVCPSSPRNINEDAIAKLLSAIPKDKRVWVDVEPAIDKLKQLKTKGATGFQIHFNSETPGERVKQWADTVGKENLWLAPRLKPDQSFHETLLDYADIFVLDTFSEEAHGGTGKTGDWKNFKKLRALYPEKTWILAGGLTPQNLPQALEETQSRFVDVNSGVESSPGIKDPDKLRALFRDTIPGRDASPRRP